MLSMRVVLANALHLEGTLYLGDTTYVWANAVSAKKTFKIKGPGKLVRLIPNEKNLDESKLFSSCLSIPLNPFETKAVGASKQPDASPEVKRVLQAISSLLHAKKRLQNLQFPKDRATACFGSIALDLSRESTTASANYLISDRFTESSKHQCLKARTWKCLGSSFCMPNAPFTALGEEFLIGSYCYDTTFRRDSVVIAKTMTYLAQRVSLLGATLSPLEDLLIYADSLTLDNVMISSNPQSLQSLDEKTRDQYADMLKNTWWKDHFELCSESS